MTLPLENNINLSMLRKYSLHFWVNGWSGRGVGRVVGGGV